MKNLNEQWKKHNVANALFFRENFFDYTTEKKPNLD